jgi:hypothetical protein
VEASRASVEVVEAPRLGARTAGGYGSAIVARPGTRQVVFTRQLASARVRWLTYDLGSGEFAEGRGFPGDLRDGLFDWDEAWLLGTYGLARVAFDPPRVIDIVREGLGSYQHRVLRLTRSLLGVTASEGKSVALIDTERAVFEKRLRMAAPDLCLEGERPVLCAFHAGEARELDVAALRLGKPVIIPEASSPLVAGDRIVAFRGSLAPYGRVISADRVEPLGYAISPERFVVLARDGLRTLREGGDARGLQQLIGVDDAGNLIATASWGLALVDPESLEVSRRITVPHPNVAACWVPEARTAVFLLSYLVDPPPGGFDPVPEKFVLVRC